LEKIAKQEGLDLRELRWEFDRRDSDPKPLGLEGDEDELSTLEREDDEDEVLTKAYKPKSVEEDKHRQMKGDHQLHMEGNEEDPVESSRHPKL
jgi:hypothetical protein